jgi:hypothetical protein
MPPVQPAPPTYDPTLLAAAAMPISAPYGAMPLPAQSSGSKVTITVLAAVLGLFVLVSGVAGALFVRESGNSKDKADQLTTMQANVADLQHQLDNAKRDLDDANDDLDDVTDKRDKIQACVEAIFAWWATDINTAESDAAEEALTTACEAAGYRL